MSQNGYVFAAAAVNHVPTINVTTKHEEDHRSSNFSKHEATIAQISSSMVCYETRIEMQHSGAN